MRTIASDCKGVERFINEANDCTVRALANAAGLPYKLAHKIMARAGRENGKGLFFKQWHPVYTRLGFKLQAVYGTTKGARYIKQEIKTVPALAGITLENLLPSLKTGRYIVKQRGHVFALVDGKILDYGVNMAGTKIQAVYKLDSQAVIFD
jgi:hypothetical protein